MEADDAHIPLTIERDDESRFRRSFAAHGMSGQLYVV
jgi:hypothetical protein